MIVGYRVMKSEIVDNENEFTEIDNSMFAQLYDTLELAKNDINTYVERLIRNVDSFYGFNRESYTINQIEYYKPRRNIIIIRNREIDTIRIIILKIIKVDL